jgi:hypothetical protein
MRKKLILASIVILPFGALAHHGANSQFDTSKEISYTGVITELRFVNPHSYITFDKTDSNGNYIVNDENQRINIHCEMLSGTALKRAGWTTEMFKPGTAIKVGGNPSRREENVCVLETMALNDGPEVSRFAKFAETTPKANLNRQARTDWGTPNISGDWADEARTNRPTRVPGSPRPEAIELTAAGQNAAAALKAKIESGEIEGNRLNCKPRDFFQDWTFNWMPNRIIQQKDKILITYGFMDRQRTIHMNLTEHPDNLTPSLSGHSIGRWENDVLIVDTIGFTENFRHVRDAISFINSEKYHTIERFSVNNEKGVLTREYKATDPSYWAEGATRTGKDVLSVSNLPWEPYNCNDLSVE